MAEVHAIDDIAPLVRPSELQPALRAFELLLLREIGLLPTLDAQTLTLEPLQADARYALVAEGGLRADNAPVTDPQMPLDQAALERGIKISVGKKKHRMLRIG